MENSDYLKNLNENQLEAVKTIDGPVMVFAGAGTCLLYTSDAADE